MECSEALDLLYSAFDGQVTPTEQALLDAHRRTCFSCAANLVKAERFQELLRHVPQLTVPRGLEGRILHRVGAKSSGASTSLNIRYLANAASRNWRGLSMASAALAAGLAVFIVAHGQLRDFAKHGAPNDTVTAMVQGSVEAVGPDLKSSGSRTGSTAISSGETLRNSSAMPATVAITPHLAMTIDVATQIRFLRVHTDPHTSAPDVVDVHLDRGTVAVRESLHRDASPIHLGTDQATMVPTGTTFAVTRSALGTHVIVAKGSVAVFTPHRVFNVVAGQGARIQGDKFSRDQRVGAVRHGRLAKPPQR
ncbi:MAG: zf-HC2 domain-containing protein [Candidatus Eremiobacteraeota bacterium]|nr:zf-HC2 domain-containing protein [Candidatus Eremiobacteraeota bacterium]